MQRDCQGWGLHLLMPPPYSWPNRTLDASCCTASSSADPLDLLGVAPSAEAECVQWSVGETPECRKRRRESLEREDADRAERRRRQIEDEADRRRLLTEARFFEVRDAAARAKSVDCTTALTLDVLMAVCYFLDLSHLGRLLFVCNDWSVAARAAAHDPTWQLTMLSAYEFKIYTVYSNALPISLTTRQRWVHVNHKKAKQTLSVLEAKWAGFTIEQMKAAGYNSYECRRVGFSLAELTGAGHLGPNTNTAQVAKAAGFTIEQMKAAGYGPLQCKVVGFSFEEARRAGFGQYFADDAARSYWFSTECRYWFC